MASKPIINQSLSSNSPLVTSITRVLQSIKPTSATNTIQNIPNLSQFSPDLNPNLVIDVIKNQTNPNHALIFFNWASSPSPNPTNYSHNPPCYTAMLDLLLSHHLLTTAAKFLKSHNKLNDFTIGKLIRAYGVKHDVNSAIDWFYRAKKVELDGNCIVSFNNLLAILVKDKYIKLAGEIFDMVVNEGLIRFDVVTYTTMITGYCKAGRVEDARKLFDKMHCRPNTVTCNAMLSGMCNKGMIVAARQIFDKMLRSKDCLPDSITYATLIEGYCKKDDMKTAIKFLDKMVNLGFRPDVITYNTIVNRFCLTGKVDEAKAMMTKMRSNGVQDNNITHTSLLKGFCVAGRMDEAVKHLKDMTSLGVNPDVHEYGIVLNEFCRLGRVNEAIALSRDMVDRGLHPSVKIVNAVLKCLVNGEKLDEALSFLKWVSESGSSPNSLSYFLVISGLCKGGRIQQVEELIDSMLRDGRQLSPSIYSSLTMMYTECGQLETASRVFYDALRGEFLIHAESFAIFMEGLCSKGRISEAEQHAQELFKKHSGSQLDNYKSVLNVLKRKYSVHES